VQLYTLDSKIRRTEVLDRYESLIWTERYSEVGDFELEIVSTPQNRALLSIGTQLALSESDRIMTVETRENNLDSDGRRMLKVKGPSLDDTLNERICSGGLPLGLEPGTWKLTGTPQQIIEQLMYNGLYNDPSDAIPYFTNGTLYPAETIPNDTNVYTIQRPFGNLYETLKELVDMWELGFRLYRGPDTSKIYFSAYTGNDRTTQQNTLTPVIFSPSLDSLQNVTEYASIAGSKNIVEVRGELTTVRVYASGATADAVNFSRRIIYVDAKDVKGTTTPAIVAELTARGQEELTKHRTIRAFDGEVSQNSQYRYNVDYLLGDLVEMRNDDGLTNQMKVTEQIFVSDAEGDRSYPTLATKLFITPGSWYSWDTNQVWFDATKTWVTA